MIEKYLKISVDTEFMGLNKDRSLISIGCVTEDDEYCFYAEISDYDETGKNDWLENNVISNLMFNQHNVYYECINETTYCKDTFSNVSKKFIDWLEYILKQYPQYDKILFVSDCCAYDTVHLFDLLSDKKTALDVPSYIIPYVYDINQQILYKNIYITLSYILLSKKHKYNTILEDPFDINREILAKVLIEYTRSTYDVSMLDDDKLKHNALFDARVINIIYNLLEEIGI